MLAILLIMLTDSKNVFIVILYTLDVLIAAIMIFINHMIYKQPDDDEKVFIKMPEV